MTDTKVAVQHVKPSLDLSPTFRPYFGDVLAEESKAEGLGVLKCGTYAKSFVQFYMNQLRNSLGQIQLDGDDFQPMESLVSALDSSVNDTIILLPRAIPPLGLIPVLKYEGFEEYRENPEAAP